MGFTTSGARNGREKKNWGGENKSGRNYLDRYCRSTPRPVFFFFSFGYRSLSGQSVVRTCRSLLAEAPSMFPTVAFATAAPGRFLFRLCHLRKLSSHLSLLSEPFLFSSTSLCPSFPSHQPGAAMRGYRSSKAATLNPSLGSGWPGAGSGGQGSRSLQHYLSQQQQQQHLHHQSTHTSYAYCPAHTAVSAGCLLPSRLSMSLSASLGMFLCLYPPSHF